MLLCLDTPKIELIPGLRRSSRISRSAVFYLRVGSVRGNSSQSASISRTEGGLSEEVYHHYGDEHFSFQVLQNDSGFIQDSSGMGINQLRRPPRTATVIQTVIVGIPRQGLHNVTSFLPGGARRVTVRVTQEDYITRVQFQVTEQEPPADFVEVLAHRRLLAGDPESWPDPGTKVLRLHEWANYDIDQNAMALVGEGRFSDDLGVSRFSRVDREVI